MTSTNEVTYTTDVSFYTMLGSEPFNLLITLPAMRTPVNFPYHKIKTGTDLFPRYFEHYVSELWNTGQLKPVVECDAALVWSDLSQQRDLGLVLSSYMVHDKQAVQRFIHDNPTLVKTLNLAPNKIEPVFGSGVGLSLELLEDPEERVECLYLKILTEHGPETSVDMLSRLDSEWWLTLRPEMREGILLDVRSVG